MTRRVVKTVFHLCGAIGGGAKGFKKARAEVAGLAGEWQCLGSIDVDGAANRDFEHLIGVRATTMDLMDRAQYVAFHGHEPPPGWREATPDDVRRAAQYQRPNAVFFSPPCKGFSGLLSEAKSRTERYVALNKLALRILWLALEAWADDPPEFLLIENVPRMLTRGRHLVDQMLSLMRSFGHAAVETVHDCGEIGGLAERRKRCLIVGRHVAKVPPLLYEPPRRPLRAVGDVLGKMRLPGDPLAGPMHRVPNLHWKTWVRLAFVEAGSDWRSLNRLAVENGHLRDYLLVPENPGAWHPNVLGVHRWEDTAGTVTSEARPTTGRFSVADIRYAEQLRNGPLGVVRWKDAAGTVAGENRATNGAFSVADPTFDPKGNDFQQYGVKRWDESMGAVINVKAPGQGSFAVQDVRCSATKHNNCFRVVRFDGAAGVVTAGGHPSAGGQAVADPCSRSAFAGKGKYIVTPYSGAANTVIGASTTGNGAFAVADPHPGMRREAGDAYLTAGHYGVVGWEQSSGTVSGSACHDNGPWSVADIRLPAPDDKLVALIRAEDGTWHRPFTTLELAALQSLFDPEDPADVAAFTLEGQSDSAWRERIGNAVPPAAAEAIATEILRTLLLADAGETFQLSSAPVWVRPIATALALDTRGTP